MEPHPVGVKHLCALFGITKQAYYKREDNFMERMALESFAVEFVKNIRLKDRGIGGTKLWKMYKKEFGTGPSLGRDAFLCILRKFDLNLRAPKKGACTTDSTHNYPLYPNLIKELQVTRLNQLWVSDITYIRLLNDVDQRSFCYLSILTDVYSREIIGWCIGDSLETSHTLKALDMGFMRIRNIEDLNLIHHSDRGVQYASVRYTEQLHERGVRISMTERGNPKDNAIAERVNGILKNEILKGMEFRSISEARKAVKSAVDFYNNQRPHMSLDMMTPSEAAKHVGILEKKWKSYRDPFLKTEEQLTIEAVI